MKIDGNWNQVQDAANIEQIIGRKENVERKPLNLKRKFGAPVINLEDI